MTTTSKHNSRFPSRTLWAVLGLSLLAGASFTLSACNTVEGVGRDVESVGDSVADTARDAKD